MGLALALLGAGHVGTGDAFDLALYEGLGVDVGTRVVLPPVEHPLQGGDQQDDAEGDDTVVHVVSRDFLDRREDEQDGGQDGPRDSDLDQGC